MIWWSMQRIKQLSVGRITAWGSAKFLFGLGLGLLFAAYSQGSISTSTWEGYGWTLVIASTILGLSAIYPIFINGNDEVERRGTTEKPTAELGDLEALRQDMARMSKGIEDIREQVADVVISMDDTRESR